MKKIFLKINKPVKIGILLLTILLSRHVAAQETASQLYSLDEILAALKPLDSKGQESFRWDPFFREGSFTVGGHYGVFPTALFAGETGILMLDNRDIYNITLPYLVNGELRFPAPFVQTAKNAFSRSISEDTSFYKISTIIIDPGHGGNQTGAIGNVTINRKAVRVVEKDINLKASKMLRDILVKAYPDKRILMTRETDITLGLDARTAIANAVPVRKNEAIIYISIHANASPANKNARGFEVWYLPSDYRRNLLDESAFSDSPDLRQIMNILTEEAFNMESVRIAQLILDSMKEAMGRSLPSRGLKEETFVVVRDSRMPAVLVELGFVTNVDDVILMTTDSHLQKMVGAVYKGIADFVTDFESSGGFIAVP